jgi:hypothetical protein
VVLERRALGVGMRKWGKVYWKRGMIGDSRVGVGRRSVVDSV